MRLLADFKGAVSCFWFFPLKTLLFVMEIKKRISISNKPRPSFFKVNSSVVAKVTKTVK